MAPLELADGDLTTINNSSLVTNDTAVGLKYWLILSIIDAALTIHYCSYALKPHSEYNLTCFHSFPMC